MGVFLLALNVVILPVSFSGCSTMLSVLRGLSAVHQFSSSDDLCTLKFVCYSLSANFCGDITKKRVKWERARSPLPSAYFFGFYIHDIPPYFVFPRCLPEKHMCLLSQKIVQ